MRNIKGFKLIAMVIVITIINMLVSIELPRFESPLSPARTAKTQGGIGGIVAFAAIAKVACFADMGKSQMSYCTANSGLLLMEGVAASSVNQYPATTINLRAPWGVLADVQFNFSSGDDTPKSQCAVLTIDTNGCYASEFRVVYTSLFNPESGSVFGLIT